ncbi:MAG: PAS domain-containing sensor histidine kinase [Rhizobiaceae bacterium]
MSVTTAPDEAWLTGIEAGCERLVHPRVHDPLERARQRRFVGVALAAPFLIAPALAPALAVFLAGPSLLAAVCAIFAIAWTCATIAAVTGSRALAEPVALTAATIAVVAAIAGGGGIAYPATLLAMALVFETYWVDRTVGRAALGGAAAGVAIVLSGVVGTYVAGSAAGTSAWAWLAPCIYFALVAARLSTMLRSADKSVPSPPTDELAQLFGAAVLKLSPTGEVVEASDEAGAVFGLPAGLLAGRSLFERVHVADRVAFMNALENMTTGDPRRTAELRIRAANNGDAGTDGRFVPVSLEIFRLPQFKGELTVVVRDNTALAALRGEIEAARQTADSTEVAKNRFLAAVSHELRTPLNAIIGFSDMMLNDMVGDLTEQQQEYVGLISSSGHHLLSVVNAILDVSRIESGAYSIRPEPFAVAEAVELCRSMMAHQAETQGVELIVSVRPDVRELAADRRAVQQIMINLLSNAIKFTPAGGSVSLDVFRQGGKLSFVVSDTGIGIAAEDFDRLGQPFTQLSNDTTRQFEGAGLGLSLVKGLVRLHEGELAVESAPGEGTVVTVTLPVDGPKSLEEEATPKAPVSAMVHAMDLKVRDETVRKTA